MQSLAVSKIGEGVETISKESSPADCGTKRLAPRPGDDIVHACSNVGKRVRSWFQVRVLAAEQSTKNEVDITNGQSCILKVLLASCKKYDPSHLDQR